MVESIFNLHIAKAEACWILPMTAIVFVLLFVYGVKFYIVLIVSTRELEVCAERLVTHGARLSRQNATNNTSLARF